MARRNRRKPSQVGGPLLIAGLVTLLGLLVAVVGTRRLGVLVFLGLCALTVWILVKGVFL